MTKEIHFTTDNLDDTSFFTTNLHHSTGNSSKRDHVFGKENNFDKNAAENSPNEQVINY